MKKLLLLLLLFVGLYASADEKLTGTAIGSTPYYDYEKGAASSKVNTADNAFDGNLNTFTATNARSNAWVGLDLGSPHVITKVGWSPRNDGVGPKRCVLGLFEASNDPTFIDAIPLYLIDQEGIIGTVSYADVHVSRGFRYVRYVGPHDSRCNIAEIEFYGHEGEGDDSQFYQVTNLPTLSYHTYSGSDPQSKTSELEAEMCLVYDDGTRIQEYPILARCRGNASYGFEKKPYRIKFNDGQSHHMMKGSALESPAKAKKWTLINNYGDKTLMRNIVAFETSRRFGMDYTVYCQPVDVLVNGEYKGCYQLCDQISTDPKRVPITEMEPTDVDGTEVTGGYLIEVDAYAGSEPSMFYSGNGIPVTIKSPGSDEIVPEQKAYINQFFNSFESVLWSGQFTDAVKGYRSKLDVESFLKHFLVGEFSGNTDTYWSVYMYKDRDEDLFYVGPSWDFDLAFNNDVRTFPVCDKHEWIFHSGGSGAPGMTGVVERILSDPYAKKRLREMWETVRKNGIITAENMVAYVDSTAQLLQASQRLNFLRWPILGQQVHENAFAYPTYEEEVAVVREYVSDRVTWIDKYFEGTLDEEEEEDEEPGKHYDIRTADELIAFAKAVNDGETTASASLLNDIDMSKTSSTFSPIGRVGRYYKGKFDGQGHRISNLIIDNNNNYNGLFGVVGRGAVIKNLVLDKSCSIRGNAYIGLVGGSNGDGTIRLECLGNEGTVTASAQNAGGIIGCNMNSTATFHIDCCYVTGQVSGGNESATLSGWVGSGAVISNCYSLASVDGVDGDQYFYRGSGTLINCYDTYGLQSLIQTTTDEAASGQLCYQLNGSDPNNTLWYQNLEGFDPVDNYPVPFKSHAKVLVDENGHYYSVAHQDQEEEDDDNDDEDDDEETFEISTADDLIAFSEKVNKGKQSINAVLVDNIDMAEASSDFTPIGRENLLYKGTFDGQGHTISHLDINLPDNDYVGLFGGVGGNVVIKNLVLDSSCSIRGRAFVGVVGASNEGGIVTLENIGNEGSVSSVNQNAGGIIGCNMNSSATFLLTNCYATGIIGGGLESAAISGWVGNSAIIKNCYSTAAVSGNDGGAYFVRGSGTTVNCYDINGSTNISITKITEEEVTNGELCYLLNGSSEEKDVVWRQNLAGTSPVDSHPVLDPTHGIVCKDEHGYYNYVDGIELLPADTNDIEGIYDLNGRRLDTLRPGINLIRHTDGTIQKILY